MCKVKRPLRLAGPSWLHARASAYLRETPVGGRGARIHRDDGSGVASREGLVLRRSGGPVQAERGKVELQGRI